MLGSSSFHVNGALFITFYGTLLCFQVFHIHMSLLQEQGGQQYSPGGLVFHQSRDPMSIESLYQVLRLI